MRNPILAAVLSVIVAGLGQIYNGQIGKGIVFIILQLINTALTVVLIADLKGFEVTSVPADDLDLRIRR